MFVSPQMYPKLLENTYHAFRQTHPCPWLSVERNSRSVQFHGTVTHVRLAAFRNYSISALVVYAVEHKDASGINLFIGPDMFGNDDRITHDPNGQRQKRTNSRRTFGSTHMILEKVNSDTTISMFASLAVFVFVS